jgi:adenine-specific DNA-methyltransferase
MSSFTPKSVDLIADLLRLGNADKNAWVLDVFAGSGTTGHSVITLNRIDSGSRKYLLTEMGDAFDGVLKPRLQKVAFSERWKDGRPERQANASNPFNGISHCIKVLRLESYEDALDNIEFNVANCWEAVGDFVEQFVGNSTRLAELRRELQECYLWWVIVIQV